jgi:hypothetical protein
MKRTKLCIKCGIDWGMPSDGCCGIDKARHQWKLAEPEERAEEPTRLVITRDSRYRRKQPAPSEVQKLGPVPPIEETETHWYNRSLAAYSESARRVGLTPRDRLLWLIQFERKLSDAEPAEMLTDMAVFMMIERDAAARSFPDPYAQRPETMPRYLNALARKLAEGLTLLVDGKPWRFRLGLPVDLVLQQTRDRVHSAWEVKSDSRTSAFLNSFMLTAIDLVRAEIQWLGRCQLPDCAQLFVRDDCRERYCSRKHGQKHRTRESRAGAGKKQSVAVESDGYTGLRAGVSRWLHRVTPASAKV